MAIGNHRIKTGKTVTRTVRLDQDIDETLSRIADNEGISTNSIVSRALHKYVDWDIYAQKFGFTSIPLVTFERLIKSIDLEEARDLGKWTGSKLAKDLMAFRFKKVDLDSALKILEMLGPKYANGYQYEYEINGRVHTVIINHRLGQNASAYYEEAVRAIFNDLLQKRTEVDGSSDSQIVMRILA